MTRLVFLAGPYKGDVDANVQVAEWYSRMIASYHRGWFAVNSHSMTHHLADLDASLRDYFLDSTRELMGRCDAMMLLPGWYNSEGATAEKAEAERMCMPVLTDFWELDKL